MSFVLINDKEYDSSFWFSSMTETNTRLEDHLKKKLIVMVKNKVKLKFGFSLVCELKTPK